MSEAVRVITESVRERVRRDGADLGLDSTLAERYVRDEVRAYSERALGGSVPLVSDEDQAAREVIAAITGFGVLQPYLDDPTVEEIWINSRYGLTAAESRGSGAGVRQKFVSSA